MKSKRRGLDRRLKTLSPIYISTSWVPLASFLLTLAYVAQLESWDRRGWLAYVFPAAVLSILASVVGLGLTLWKLRTGRRMTSIVLSTLLAASPAVMLTVLFLTVA